MKTKSCYSFLHLVFPDKPCIPEGPVIVDALLKSSIVISWKAPKDDGGSMITNYIVEKREAKEGEQWHLVSSSVSGTTCRVPNLIESAGYYFRVSAQNQYGVSEPLEIPSVVIVKSPFGKSIRSFCKFCLLWLHYREAVQALQ